MRTYTGSNNTVERGYVSLPFVLSKSGMITLGTETMSIGFGEHIIICQNVQLIISAGCSGFVLYSHIRIFVKIEIILRIENKVDIIIVTYCTFKMQITVLFGYVYIR